MLSDRDYYRAPNPGQRRNFWNSHSITVNLIVINVAVFILQWLTNGGINQYFALAPVMGFPRIIWQCFTYQFLHGGFGHIFWNMYSLFLFGRFLEQSLGRRRFLALYLVSGVLGGIFFTLANFNTLNYCVGASGAVCGVMAATALVYPHMRLFIFGLIPVKLWWFAAGYFLLELLNHSQGSVSGIAHCAHLGGGLAGALYLLFKGNSAVAPAWLRNLFRPSVKPPKNNGGWHAAPPPPPPPREPREFDRRELDRILDKMSRQGYDQLTPEEKETMREAAAELRRRRGE